MDPTNFDPNTGQRTDVTFDPVDGRPQHATHRTTRIDECSATKAGYRIQWEDGVVSEYTSEWVETQLSLVNSKSSTTTSSDKRIPWANWDEALVRSSQELSILFGEALTKQGMNRTLSTLYKYGILLITDTPTQDNGAGIAALASSLGGGALKTKENSILANYRNGSPLITLPHGTDGPLRTLYGTVWSTTSSSQSEGASIADSAYGHESLPLHTDMTYLRDPPGLQIFTMAHPALEGGESIFADGLYTAKVLRNEDFKSFQLLSERKRKYSSIDRYTGWCLEATGPVIQTNDNGDIVQLRHNDLDRMPDISLADEVVDRIRQAHSAWNTILARDETRLVMSLRPGDTVVVANQVRNEFKTFNVCLLCILQRCFHGRYRFSADAGSNRVVMGCYVCQDELNSRFRMLGYDVL